jgi:hypothetical protein
MTGDELGHGFRLAELELGAFFWSMGQTRRSYRVSAAE